jgi:hypothetical protein
MMPEYAAGGAEQDPTAVMNLAQDAADSMGEEGDSKARGQPRIPGLEGIEFETGM